MIEDPTHSDYLTALVETGIFGFILYYSIYIFSMIKAIRINMKNTDSLYILFCVIVILLVALGRSNHMNIPTFIFLALLSNKNLISVNKND